MLASRQLSSAPAIAHVPPRAICAVSYTHLDVYKRQASYGQIARLIGREKNSRLVGAVLSEADRYGDYPCHRVVNHAGRLAPNFPDQRALLLSLIHIYRLAHWPGIDVWPDFGGERRRQEDRPDLHLSLIHI